LDPKADDFPWVNPYNYAENSPIANVDLWGLQAESVHLITELIILKIKYDEKKKKNQEKLENIGKTIVRMDKVERDSKGANIFEFGFGPEKKIKNLGKVSARAAIVVNEDEGTGAKVSTSAKVNNVLEVELSETYYYESNSTKGEMTAQSKASTSDNDEDFKVEDPTGSVKVNVSAVGRVFEGMMEFIDNFVDQRIDEIKNPQKYHVPAKN
jgi:hypothetical protein